MNDSPATTLPDAQEQPHHKLRERWAPLGLVLFGGFWNFFVSPMGETVNEEDWRMYPIFVVLGSLFVQPMLCAVWGAWSAQAWVWRVPLGLAACVFLSLAGVTTGDVGNMLVGMVGIHLLFVVVLAFVRWRFQFVLAARTMTRDGVTSKSTFGLSYLFLWMTVAAVLTGLARMLTFGTQNWGMGIGQLFTFLFAFSLVLAPPAWLLAYLLRPAWPRLRDVIAIVISVPLSTVIPAIIMWFESPGSSFLMEMYLPSFFIALGAMVTVALVAMAMRWAGYRIYRIHPS